MRIYPHPSCRIFALKKVRKRRLRRGSQPRRGTDRITIDAASLWAGGRSPNLATVRYRTKLTKRGSREASMAMAFKLLDAAQGPLAAHQRPRTRPAGSSGRHLDRRQASRTDGGSDLVPIFIRHGWSPQAPMRGSWLSLPAEIGGWWARLVSNQRPLACEASALPLSYAPERTVTIPRRTTSSEWLGRTPRGKPGRKETAARARVAPPSIAEPYSSDARNQQQCCICPMWTQPPNRATAHVHLSMVGRPSSLVRPYGAARSLHARGSRRDAS